MQIQLTRQLRRTRTRSYLQQWKAEERNGAEAAEEQISLHRGMCLRNDISQGTLVSLSMQIVSRRAEEHAGIVETRGGINDRVD